ncbi:unnamed protein product, partial [marine sediment metagenome]
MQLNMSERKGKHGRAKFEREDRRSGYYGFHLSLRGESNIF